MNPQLINRKKTEKVIKNLRFYSGLGGLKRAVSRPQESYQQRSCLQCSSETTQDLVCKGLFDPDDFIAELSILSSALFYDAAGVNHRGVIPATKKSADFGKRTAGKTSA